MLLRLLIRDFAIVDRLELEFDAGFGALTGETGAGKSILVDALSLVLGERADASAVRAGAERAEVSAEFSLEAGDEVATWLRANDFDADACLVRRVVDAAGRSRAYINGTAATLGQLRELGDRLADIHGQHAHHQLLRGESQRALLDAQGGATALAAEVAAAYAGWRAARMARTDAERDVEAASRERELLTWQVKELAALDFTLDGWRETEQEQRRLANAAGLLERVGATLVTLDDGEAAVLEVLRHGAARLREAAELDPSLAEAADLLDAARVQAEESALALRRYQDRLELDPGRLAGLDARIDSVLGLARKHRSAPDELPGVLARLSARLEELTLRADPEALVRREEEAAAEFRQRAQRLSAIRNKVARDLSAAVTAGMQDLAMNGGVFEVALDPCEPMATGLESVEFRVSANAGQPLRPLARVASGGELSRIGLALQVIASQARGGGTLVFDEVDVGIGGRVAEVVGRLLKALGASRQVLCVTHLPQVAAQADWQWSIAKENAGGITRSTVAVLDRAGRVEEVARMLGGETITDTTRRHAAEMLGY